MTDLRTTRSLVVIGCAIAGAPFGTPWTGPLLATGAALLFISVKIARTVPPRPRRDHPTPPRRSWWRRTHQ